MNIRKLQSAVQHSGRGMDNTYTPARYGVFDGDIQRYSLLGSNRVPYQGSEWVLYDVQNDYRRVKTFDSFKAAQAWVNAQDGEA